MKIKVSDVIARFLAAKKMEYVFGIVGAGNAHIFDSITSLGESTIVGVHHEQAACMAMQTYFKISGVVTASLLTTGGGAANGITGIVGAWMDSVPSLIIAGNEPSRHVRADNPLRIYGTQGFDSVSMVKGVTKYAVRVVDPARILFELEKAYCIASTGRPGPCWVEVSLDTQSLLIEESSLVPFISEDRKALLPPPSPTLAADVETVLQMLREAKRPLLWLGVGIRLAGAAPNAAALLDRVRVPSLVSWSAIDLVDSNHPLVYGRAGLYGGRAANFVLQNCDLLVAIGTRMAVPQVGYDISELARAARIVVIDIDPDELAKYAARIDRPIRANAADFIDGILSATGTPVEAPAAWIQRCDDYRTRYPELGPEHQDKNGFINSYRFMDRLNSHFKPDQVVVTDMGTALLSGHQILKFKPPQRFMTSQGLGEMGFGLPAAIGASFARNKGEVLCLNCDGGMMMNLQELQTIVHHNLPVKIIIFNNDGYLMIKHTQNSWFAGRRSVTDKASGVSCPDYSALAHAFGFPAFQIRTWEDFHRVLPQVQAATGAVICEVFMDPEQLFVPKLGAVQSEGRLVSPPLEDLGPLLPRDELRANMIVGMHPKSEGLIP